MPPNPPWQELPHAENEAGYLSFYYSDPLARYPVRHITKLADNKSDPNLETMTYGLFSTCEERMRQGIVRDLRRWIFFLTNYRGMGRAITGFYEIGWHAPGPGGPRDIALAAAQMRFIDPIPVNEVRGHLGERVQIRFRPYMGLSPEHTVELRELIEAKPERTQGYLTEIARLEAYSVSVCGYTYPTWSRERPFGTDEAAAYLTPAEGEAPNVGNTSPTNRWRCGKCEEESFSLSRLKKCPHCGAIGMLAAIQAEEV
jgi:hypothetical protein